MQVGKKNASANVTPCHQNELSVSRLCVSKLARIFLWNMNVPVFRTVHTCSLATVPQFFSSVF